MELTGARALSSFASLENTMKECTHAWGNRDKEAPGPHSVGIGGSSPAPPHTSRRLLARSRQASSTEEGKCTAKGLPKPPALSHRGPGVRDRAEFRAEAEPAAIGLAWGEATVLQFLPAL